MAKELGNTAIGYICEIGPGKINVTSKLSDASGLSKAESVTWKINYIQYHYTATIHENILSFIHNWGAQIKLFA